MSDFWLKNIFEQDGVHQVRQKLGIPGYAKTEDLVLGNVG